MADDTDNKQETPVHPPAAVVETRGGFSFIWLVPIVAVVVGSWLGYRTLSERGPTVTISFETGDGLEAGKTKIKYRDIEVGKVSSVTLADDLSHVIVTAELHKGGSHYLTDNSRFWVTRARVSGGQVTGIGTIFGGAYIGFEPSTEGERRRDFVGLEAAPVLTIEKPGRRFTLRSRGLGSIDAGAPVTYRSITVGQVLSHELDPSGEFVTVSVFVDAPHDDRVRENTRFWNASGLDVTMDATGVRVDTPSLVSMLIGGVAFDAPETSEPVPAAKQGSVFELFRNKRDSVEQSYSETSQFLMYFSGSVQGLVPGSPVVFRGIKIGEVVDVKLRFDQETVEFRIPVLVELELDRFEQVGDQGADDEKSIDQQLIERGLRAQLGRGNLLTGQLQVEFDIHPDAPPAEIRHEDGYRVFPTIPAPLSTITASLTRIVDRVDSIPLDEIGADMQASIKSLRTTLAEAEGVTKQLNAEVLVELQQTLASVNAMLAADSPTRRELQRVLTEMVGAARSVRLLADQLEQSPESLLRGKKGE